MRISKTLKQIQLDKVFGIIEFGEGCRKLILDFQYMFKDRLNLGSIIVWDDRQDGLKGKYDVYICCTYERDNAEKKLSDAGLIYLKDYYYAEDLFGLLDDLANCKIAYKAYPGTLKGWIKAVAFGHAAKCGIVMPDDKFRSLLCGDYKDGEESCKEPKGAYAFSYLAALPEVFTQIFTKGKQYEKYDYICFHSVADAVRFKKDYPSAANKVITVEDLKAHAMASKYMRAVYYDRRQNECDCTIPFDTMWVGIAGTTRICDCPSFLDLSCGNLGITGGFRVWNSPLAEIIRLSVANGNYTFCSRSQCGKLLVDREQANPSEYRKPSKMDYPLNISIANDSLCNLHCPSCRKECHVKYCADEKTELEACTDALFETGWLETAERIVVGGSGETFFSDNYKKILYESIKKEKEVVVMTNGTLFSTAEWEKMEGKPGRVSFLVSVDAATKETYEKVRCGGNYERLMVNMEFLSKLRRENKIASVIVVMVVQRANYKEIPDFIRWVKDLGFDRVNLSRIRNWGTYPEEYFYNCVSMFDKNGKPSPELVEILKMPICNDKIVSKNWETL